MNSRWATTVVIALLGVWGLPTRGQDQAALAYPDDTLPTPVENWDYQSVIGVERDHVLYFEAGALWLARNQGDSVVVGRVIDRGTLQTLQTFTTGEISYGFEPGVKILLGLILDSETRIETSYFGLNEWYRGGSLQTDNTNEPVFSPYLQYGILPAGAGSAGQSYPINSHVHNVEVNLKRFLTAWNYLELSSLVGFRYFNLNEAMTLSQSFTTPPADAPAATGEQTRSLVNNHLLGLQLGGEILEDLGPLQLGAQLTAGAFANIASAKINNFQTTSGPNANIFSTRDDAANVSALVQLGLTAEYMLFENVALRGGYDFIFITGLAFAPDQYASAFTQGVNGIAANGFRPVDIDQGSFAFYHGPSVTLVIFW